MSRRMKIAVLYGGDSSERDISLETGEAVIEALDHCGHYVRPIDVRNRNLDELDRFECDLAFIALHGPFGEDGQVQLLLEMRGIPYTGSGVEASRIAMDKAATKERFRVAGIPTPEGEVLSDDSRAEEIRSAIVSVGFPQIIKPAREGSSVGVTVARSVLEAMAGLELSFGLDSHAIVERMIRGRELTVGVLGSRALPIIELVYPGVLFDKHAKYTEGVTTHVIEPELPDDVGVRVRDMAITAHNVLGCRDISRVDIMLSADNTPYVLEVNTIPGMTSTSLVPDAARAGGIEFPELCQTLARWSINAAARTRVRREI